ncbi:MAG: DUF4173 domain-containing protein [Bdellovibrionales bacterium]|nr:DUF4173 domain-containing protein [Bdellovibrionales bacterium]
MNQNGLQTVSARQAALAGAASALFVLGSWNVWTNGSYALGLNASVFLLLILFAFKPPEWSEKLYVRRALPFFLMALSFALYENPFLKYISWLVFLPALSLYYQHEFVSERLRWSALSVACAWTRAVAAMFSWTVGWSNIKRHLPSLRFLADHASLFLRIAKGVCLLLLLSGLVVVPLLASVDEDFAKAADAVYQAMSSFFEWITLTDLAKRTIVFLLLCLTITATIAISARPAPDLMAHDTQEHDPLSGAIVLGGLLVLYFAFLGLQAGKLLTSSLPDDFSTVEQLVKGGFWQLIVLTALNIVLTVSYVRCTQSALRSLLGVFIAASMLLLVSAGWRMALYVVFYGLSYEKFFAAYSVLYCAAVLCYLAWQHALQSTGDIVRTLGWLLAWMYAGATVLPVESIIFHTNVTLATRTDARLHLDELTMLSPDVLYAVPQTAPFANCRWVSWKVARSGYVRDKQWYEHTLSSVLNSRHLFSEDGGGCLPPVDPAFAEGAYARDAVR